MLARWTEPFAIRDDHERRPETRCVIAAVAGVAQQNLRGTDKSVLHCILTLVPPNPTCRQIWFNSPAQDG